MRRYSGPRLGGKPPAGKPIPPAAPMVSIHELYGRQAEELQRSREAHDAETAGLLTTIDLLRKLKAGEVSLDAVEVLDRGWRLKSAEELAAEANRKAREQLLAESNGAHGG
jgi:hypothetical protein